MYTTSVRTAFFFDGYSMYHAMDRDPALRRYKWLDLRLLANQLLNSQADRVLYFTAYCTWDHEKTKRHKNYVSALVSRGVHVVQGKFIPVTLKLKPRSMRITDMAPYILDIQCLPDMIEYKTYAEKRTDVNIATKILDFAYQDHYDHAFIITADNDIAPAVETAKNRFPKKQFTLVVPPGKVAPGDLVRACDGTLVITEDHLKNSQLPNPVVAGKDTLFKPAHWR